MNVLNLPSDVSWSLVATGLLGLVLARQAIIASYGIDILERLSAWCSKNFIALSSLLLIAAPFLFPYLLRQARETSGEFSAASIDRALTILATATSIFIGNSYLENFRGRREQKKIAKLLVVGLESHLEQLPEIISRLNGTLMEGEAEHLKKKVELLQNDSIYEIALKQIGGLDFQHLSLIADYSRKLNSTLGAIVGEVDPALKTQHLNLSIVGPCRKKLEELQIDAMLNVMLLSKKVIKDDKKFDEYKELAAFHYSLRAGSRTGKQSLKRVELVFEEFGLLSDLESACRVHKEREEYWKEQEIHD